MSVRYPSLLLTVALCASAAHVSAQAPSAKEEITYITDNRKVPDAEWQAELRQRSAWRAFKAQHPRWSVEFNEATGMPRRAYGQPIPGFGGDPSQGALGFLTSELAAYDLPVTELVVVGVAPTAKLTYVHFEQVHQGLTVFGARAMVKLDTDGRVIGFGADLYTGFTVDLQPTLDAVAALPLAGAGLVNIVGSEHLGTQLLPVPNGRAVDMHLVHEVMVRTMDRDTPGRYRCLVDAHTGQLWYRTNEVLTCDHGANDDDAGADVQMVATAYPGNPLGAPVVQNLPDMEVTVGGTLFRTDANGFLASGVSGPVASAYQMRGRWADVMTNGTTPYFTGNLNEGSNTVSFNTNSTINERSAYIYANQIHAHAKLVLPDFEGMDYTVPVRVDITSDNCNANYDGSGINFFAEANNCRSMCTLNDVVFHEYGHGINDKFYDDFASDFSNGAMNEGYADWWAMTLTQSPILGLGLNLDDVNSSVRRYDEAPKVYPVDIVGEVHADGEIICGAWWDMYVGLGNDMALTLELFAASYPGLQAAVVNGNEGQAFRDVLLDVLQADDDDADITNGTPNGAAIVEAFGIHGITLISDADLIHDGIMFALEETTLTINVDLIIMFPSTEYLEDVTLYYRVNDAVDWIPVAMTSPDESAYYGDIPAQPIGTVISYHVALTDIFGQKSSVTPIGADREDSNLSFYVLVGYQLNATENADNLSELGIWTQGLPTDNAETGNWEFGSPVGSYSVPGDPSTVVQPGDQHTAGGEFCWFTGNSASTAAPLGDNDVDGGTTTLVSPTIDLSALDNPVVSYWRWYVNNPPSGANPNADWWQVSASSNGGSTWVPVEETKTSERNWRRKAFRVRDVLGDVSSIRLKFNASDSLRPGTNLDGGSLVEAALDDIELWDEVSGSAVEEVAAVSAAAIWPTPANGHINVEVNNGGAKAVEVEMLDMTGRRVLQPVSMVVGQDVQRMDVSRLAEGQYILRLLWNGGSHDSRFSIVR